MQTSARRTRGMLFISVMLVLTLAAAPAHSGAGAHGDPVVAVDMMPPYLDVGAGGAAHYFVTVRNAGEMPIRILEISDEVHGPATSLLSSFIWPGKGTELHPNEEAAATLTFTAPEVTELDIIPNSVTVRYRVKGNRYQTTSDEQLIYVLPMIFVSVHVSPESPGSTETPFSFTASAFYFDDQLINTGYVRWDLDGDGRFDTPPLPFAFDRPDVNLLPEFTHIYRTPGTYHVVAEVSDDAGAVGRAEITIKVEPAPEIGVRIFVTPAAGTPGTEFTFMPRARYLPDDERITEGFVRWDVDNDGLFDTPFSYFAAERAIIVPHAMRTRFNTPGDHTIVVEVRDMDGNTGRGSVTMTVGSQ